MMANSQHRSYKIMHMFSTDGLNLKIYIIVGYNMIINFNFVFILYNRNVYMAVFGYKTKQTEQPVSTLNQS